MSREAGRAKQDHLKKRCLFMHFHALYVNATQLFLAIWCDRRKLNSWNILWQQEWSKGMHSRREKGEGKLLGGLSKWLDVKQATDAFKVTRNWDDRKGMIANAGFSVHDQRPSNCSLIFTRVNKSTTATGTGESHWTFPRSEAKAPFPDICTTHASHINFWVR